VCEHVWDREVEREREREIERERRRERERRERERERRAREREERERDSSIAFWWLLPPDIVSTRVSEWRDFEKLRATVEEVSGCVMCSFQIGACAWMRARTQLHNWRPFPWQVLKLYLDTVERVEKKEHEHEGGKSIAFTVIQKQQGDLALAPQAHEAAAAASEAPSIIWTSVDPVDTNSLNQIPVSKSRGDGENNTNTNTQTQTHKHS
jgi:hypothetical protein